VEQWAAGRQFFNAYGPTEVTIWATVAQLSDKPRLGARLPHNKFIYWMLIFSLYRLLELYIGGTGGATSIGLS